MLQQLFSTAPNMSGYLAFIRVLPEVVFLRHQPDEGKLAENIWWIKHNVLEKSCVTRFFLISYFIWLVVCSTNANTANQNVSLGFILGEKKWSNASLMYG